MPRHPRAEVDIDAPLDRVWEVMLDTASYGVWNPFIEKAECTTPEVGQPIVLHVRFGNGRTARSPERISVLEGPRDDAEGVRRATLAYVFEGWPARLRLVRGTRYQRLSQRPGEPTHYATVEEFRGPAVALAGPARVQDGFERHAAALKVRCERPPAGEEEGGTTWETKSTS